MLQPNFGESAAYGVSQLCGTVACGIALDHKVLGGLAHLDSISISVSGELEQPSSVDGEQTRLMDTSMLADFYRLNSPDEPRILQWIWKL
jgi:hypothetical protein